MKSQFSEFKSYEILSNPMFPFENHHFFRRFFRHWGARAQLIDSNSRGLGEGFRVASDSELVKKNGKT